MKREVIVLAAGQGSRMRSQLPKVLHELAGRPLLAHVLDTAQALQPVAVHAVIGHGADAVRAAFSDRSLNWVLQAEQKGTGHAVQQVLPALQADARVLILYGDVPLVPLPALKSLLEAAGDAALALLTTELNDPTGYGRIVRDADGRVTAIVEHKDATPEQQGIREVNTGILSARVSDLVRWLPRLSNNNRQGEFYLTDIVAMAVADGVPVLAETVADSLAVQGVNDRQQLATQERYYQQQQAERLMREGVTLRDPARFDLRGRLQAGQDVVIDINVVIEGDVCLGDGVRIGPNCVLKDCELAAGVQVQANSLIDSSRIGPDASIGPFARLRPGTVLAERTRIGNFVETKNARVGEDSKINHLSYIGDAEIGHDVNVGAGTITCNYDGVRKSRTVIEDGAFIGSNTALVAPVTVGVEATVGAGSTVTRDVPARQLAVGRGRQKNIDHWQRPQAEKDH